MIQSCYICKKVYGDKEPLESKEITHGVCPSCWPEEFARLQRAIGRWEREKERLISIPAPPEPE